MAADFVKGSSNNEEVCVISLELGVGWYWSCAQEVVGR